MSDTNQTQMSQSTEDKSSTQQPQPQPVTTPENHTEKVPESTSQTTTNIQKKNNNLQDTEAASLLMLFQSQNPSNSKPSSPVNSPTSTQNETFSKGSTAPAPAPAPASASAPASVAQVQPSSVSTSKSTTTTTTTTTTVDDKPDSVPNSSKVTPPQKNASLAETKTHKRNPSQQRLSPPLINSLSTRSPGPVAAAMSNNNRKGAVAAAALAAAAALPLPSLMREKNSNNKKQNDSPSSSPTSTSPTSATTVPPISSPAPIIPKSEIQEKETSIKKEDNEDKQVKKETMNDNSTSTSAPTTADSSSSSSSSSTPPPYAVDQDSGIIGCICGFEHDDGFTIQCDRCFRWQHAICMSIEDMNDVPDNYLCYLCDKSLKIDKALAIKIQKERLLNLNNSDNDNEDEEDNEDNENSSSIAPILDQKPQSTKSGKSNKTSKSNKSKGTTGLGISTTSKEIKTSNNDTNENIKKDSSDANSSSVSSTSASNSSSATVKVEKIASDSSAKTPGSLPASSTSLSSSASSSSPPPPSSSVAANSSVTTGSAKSPKQKQQQQLETQQEQQQQQQQQQQTSSSPPASSQSTNDKTSSDNTSQNNSTNAITQESAKPTPPPQPTRGKPGRRGKGRAGRAEPKTNANDKLTPLNEDIDSSIGRYQTLYYHIEHLEYKSSTVKHLINKLPELLNNSNDNSNNITNDAIKLSVDEFNNIFPDLQNYKKYLQIKTLPDNPKQKFTGISKLGLYTLKSLSKNDEIIILNGEIEMKQNYIDERWNHYKTLGCPKPNVFFHPHLPIVFDQRGFGNFSRFIRKSCNPNCEIKTYILDDGSIKFGLVAKRSINQSTELTLPWEWDVDHPIREIIEGKSFENIQIRRKVELMKSIGLLLDLCECADSNLNDCYLQVVRKASSYLQRSTRKSGSSSNGNDNSNTKADEISALEFEGSYLPIMNRFNSRDLTITQRVNEMEHLWETGKLRIVNDCLVEAGAESEDENDEDIANATNGDIDEKMTDTDKITDSENKSIETGNEVENSSTENGAENDNGDINKSDIVKQKNDVISNISNFIRFSVKKRPFSSFANSDILNSNVPLKYDVLKKTKFNPRIIDTPSVLTNTNNNSSNELAIPFEVHIINTPQQKESKLTATIFKDEDVIGGSGVKSELYDLRFGSGSTGSKKFNTNLSIDNTNNIVKTESIVPGDVTSLVVKGEDGEHSVNSNSVNDIPTNASGIIDISGGSGAGAAVTINPSSSTTGIAVMDNDKPKVVKKFSLADYKKSKANKV
ncbi:hypothetical protein B5S31_g4453 [[Candida] boidinii]|nr:hypothetical protein B5S31_g4453 [[Candida] boidinii]